LFFLRKKDQAILDLDLSELCDALDKSKRKTYQTYDAHDILITHTNTGPTCRFKDKNDNNLLHKDVISKIENCHNLFDDDKSPIAAQIINPSLIKKIGYIKHRIVIYPDHRSMKSEIDIINKHICEPWKAILPEITTINISKNKFQKSLEEIQKKNKYKTLKEWIFETDSRKSLLPDIKRKTFDKLLDQYATNSTGQIDVSTLHPEIRNNMQQRRLTTRQHKEFIEFLSFISNEVAFYFYDLAGQAWARTNSNLIYDSSAEISAKNASYRIIIDNLIKLSSEKTKQTIKRFGIDDSDRNPIKTLNAGVLIILSDFNFKIRVPCLTLIFSELDKISME
jgi:hypothetical protein